MRRARSPPLPHHDPLGRDRLISCGAALEHVQLAVRVLGWVAAFDLRPDRHHPDEVGWVTATGRAEPSDVDLRRYDAISARHSYGRPFSPQPVDTELRQELLSAPEVDGVGVRLVHGDVETTVLAGILSHAALATAPGACRGPVCGCDRCSPESGHHLWSWTITGR